MSAVLPNLVLSSAELGIGVQCVGECAGHPRTPLCIWIAFTLKQHLDLNGLRKGTPKTHTLTKPLQTHQPAATLDIGLVRRPAQGLKSRLKHRHQVLGSRLSSTEFGQSCSAHPRRRLRSNDPEVEEWIVPTVPGLEKQARRLR